MKETYQQDSTEEIILVDASNAFNSMNRQTALHNIQYICPPLARVLINTYWNPSQLFITGGDEILSKEGTTQGDNLAMLFYSLGMKPLLDKLSKEVPQVKQVWLADDASGAGTLLSLKKWWDIIISEGQKLGYYVNESKSWLIIKDRTKLETAKQIFGDSNIKFTCEGKRHLGAATGTNEFRIQYVSEKVEEWCKEMKRLSALAKTQPHAAFSAYIHGEQHKFTYFLRTIEGMNELIKPLDDIIMNNFLPAVFGETLSPQEICIANTRGWFGN